MRSRSVVGAGLLVVAVATPAHGQIIANFERRQLPQQPTLLSRATLDKRFWDALAALRAEEEKQRSLKADITFGLSGDESGARSLFKLNTGISLSRGDYPSEVTVANRIFLQMRDGQLQEDVTTLQITYDYHTKRALEYFTFAERFTDSFLSIQQRYEVGFGARTGMSFGRVGNFEETDRHFSTVRQGLGALCSATGARWQEPPGRDPVCAGPVEKEYQSLWTALDNLEHAVEDGQQRLFLGLAASVFAEIERAELEVTSLPVGGVTAAAPAITSKVTLPSEQRYRLTLRPTFRFRASKEVLITIYPYFKLPIDGPRRVMGADGVERLDYRRDVLSNMAWTIKQDQTGLENVELLFTLNHFFDNVPPTLLASTIADAASQGRVFRTTSAEGRHRVVALALRLRW